MGSTPEPGAAAYEPVASASALNVRNPEPSGRMQTFDLGADRSRR